MSIFRSGMMLIVICLSAAGCQLFTEPDETLLMYVAPETVTCLGFVQQQCLQIRFDPSGERELLYDGIRGFDFEPGFEYTLLVRRHRIEDPPQDSSSIEYTLLRTVEKRAVEG